jgi:predicted GIY-YIG superfamily endonuclease
MPSQKAFVYLIKFSGFLGNPESHIARYYLGSTTDLRSRMEQHRSSCGAAILRACNERNISYRIVKIHVCPDEASARKLERKLKNYKNHNRVADLNWNQIMKSPTVAEIREQIQATGGILKYLEKLKRAIAEDDSIVAEELDNLILGRKLLR